MSTISSGITSLDNLIDSVSIGDNVVWEVDAGTSYGVFIRNFIIQSFRDSQKVIYISFNRSPQTILNELSQVIAPEHFIFVDGFTSGKGKNDATFLGFYDRPSNIEVVRIPDPRNIDQFTEKLNAIEDRFPPGARYVFDSLTGMQDLWGDESETHRFFTYMCPRLYDLGTVAYWVLEKEAHSPKFKANLRHITQVAFDLYKRKNSLYIKALKLEGRRDREAFKPHQYVIHQDAVSITLQKKEPVTDIGFRLREARTRLGMSQKELAEKVDLTPSFLSQLENNQVSPSLGTFLQICRALDTNPGQFLEGEQQVRTPWLIRKGQVAASVPVRDGAVMIYPVIAGEKLSARMVVFPAGAVLLRKGFCHRDEEMVYVVEGKLLVTIEGKEERAEAGDAIFLRDALPSQWRNEGGEEATIFVVG
jgi:transcriptional regulator with XRE-family HTH domain